MNHGIRTESIKVRNPSIVKNNVTNKTMRLGEKWKRVKWCVFSNFLRKSVDPRQG